MQIFKNVLVYTVCLCLMFALMGCAAANPQLGSQHNSEVPTTSSTPSSQATPSSSATTPSTGADDTRYDPALAASQIPEDMKQTMRQTFIEQFFKHSGLKTEDIRIERVFGLFGDTVVLFIDSAELQYGDAVRHEYVNGLVFTFGSTHMLQVYNNGHYYTILEAFEAQLLSAEQVQTVYDNYEKYVAQRLEDNA